jgi:excisionase family DNA binding protein
MNHHPLAHSVSQACALACAGRTSVYEAIRYGDLRAVKRGRRTLILDDDLKQWVQSLPPVNAKCRGGTDEEGDRRASHSLSDGGLHSTNAPEFSANEPARAQPTDRRGAHRATSSRRVSSPAAGRGKVRARELPPSIST